MQQHLTVNTYGVTITVTNCVYLQLNDIVTRAIINICQ